MTHVICPLKFSRFNTENGSANDIVCVRPASGFTGR